MTVSPSLTALKEASLRPNQPPALFKEMLKTSKKTQLCSHTLSLKSLPFIFAGANSIEQVVGELFLVAFFLFLFLVVALALGLPGPLLPLPEARHAGTLERQELVVGFA